jgi:hypothetical protein
MVGNVHLSKDGKNFPNLIKKTFVHKENINVKIFGHLFSVFTHNIFTKAFFVLVDSDGLIGLAKFSNSPNKVFSCVDVNF